MAKTYTEADIPQNDAFKPQTFGETVSETIRILLSRMADGTPYKLATVFLYDQERETIWISQAAATVAAQSFKNRGYYAHWESAKGGVPYAMTITAFPTNCDI